MTPPPDELECVGGPADGRRVAWLGTAFTVAELPHGELPADHNAISIVEHVYHATRRPDGTYRYVYRP